MSDSIETHSVDENLGLLDHADSIDRVNAAFYGRFPFPWMPQAVEAPLDPDFGRVMLNQNLGDWTHTRVPRAPAIWIAGCGTNQAVITALRFPESRVIGSDLSGPSLEVCAATARQLEIQARIELRNESLNEVAYREQFDYILCTGVIHHNADPGATLARLTRALKPSGVLELMVYNRYHRILTSACQKAVRLLAGSADGLPRLDAEFAVTRAVVRHCPGNGLMRQTLVALQDTPDVQLADALMQPIEHSYTVETLDRLAAQAGLTLVTPCLNAYDHAAGTFAWHLRFQEPGLQATYDALPDAHRWQVTNLLLLERSPMLWFYLQRQDCPTPRRTEQAIADAMLETRFRRTRTETQPYVRRPDQGFRKAAPVPHPGSAPPDLRRLLDGIDAREPLGAALDRLGLARDFSTVTDLRSRLTTSAFAHLTAVS